MPLQEKVLVAGNRVRRSHTGKERRGLNIKKNPSGRRNGWHSRGRGSNQIWKERERAADYPKDYHRPREGRKSAHAILRQKGVLAEGERKKIL